MTDPGNRLMHDQAQISALPARGGARTFRNEPLLELRRGAVRTECLTALAALDDKLPLEVPMLIGEDVVTAPGGASSWSIETPRAWSARNESLEVFSSRRRTR